MIKHDYDTARISLIGDRKINQDRCTIVDNDESLFLALADGMGGHPKGEVAAQILIDTAEQQIYRTPSPILSPGSFLTRLLHKAHESIMAYGYDQDPPIDPRTTAVVCLIQDGVAYWGHAGDSRLYLFRNGKVFFQTTDDSYVERLRQQGVISEEETDKHPQRNYVTRCLGGALISPEITLGKQALQTGDRLLICTDGLWGSMPVEKISELMTDPMDLEDIALELAETAARNAYPESDNVTLMVIEIGEQRPDNIAVEKPVSDNQQKEIELNSAIAELQNAINNFNKDTDQE